VGKNISHSRFPGTERAIEIVIHNVRDVLEQTDSPGVGQNPLRRGRGGLLVVIPVLNDRLISECLKSIEINTHRLITTVLVVDDGSEIDLVIPPRSRGAGR